MEVMFDSESVASAIASSRRSLETREAVIGYFQERYPGVKYDKKGKPTYEWKKKIVDAELALNPGAKRASLNKRYQKEKGVERYLKGKPSPGVQKQYRDLSAMLPKEYHVRGTLCVAYSPGICEARNIDITFTGQNAKGLSDNPDLQGIFNVYQFGKYEPDTMSLTQAGGVPCETDDHENPRRPGKIIKGCTPSLFVTASFAGKE